MLKINLCQTFIMVLAGCLLVDPVFSDPAQLSQPASNAQSEAAEKMQRAERRAQWAALTPEQRDQKRAERKAKLDGLSPSERAQRMTQRRALESDRPRKLDSENRGEGRGGMLPRSPEAREAFRQARKEKLDALSPEEREVLRKTRKEKWDSLSPEDREVLREMRKEKRAALSPEEREVLRQTRKEQFKALSPEARD